MRPEDGHGLGKGHVFILRPVCRGWAKTDAAERVTHRGRPRERLRWSFQTCRYLYPDGKGQCRQNEDEAKASYKSAERQKARSQA